jgi:hypothetical protein
MTPCPTCGADPCANPAFCANCRDADRRKARGEQPRYSTADRPINWSESDRLASLRRLLNTSVSLDRTWHELNRYEGAPRSTVEALMYSLRERGLSALREANTQRRLAQLNDEQLIQIGNRLQRLKPEIARPWTPDEIKELMRSR